MFYDAACYCLLLKRQEPDRKESISGLTRLDVSWLSRKWERRAAEMDRFNDGTVIDACTSYVVDSVQLGTDVCATGHLVLIGGHQNCGWRQHHTCPQCGDIQHLCEVGLVRQLGVCGWTSRTRSRAALTQLMTGKGVESEAEIWICQNLINVPADSIVERALGYYSILWHASQDDVDQIDVVNTSAR